MFSVRAAWFNLVCGHDHKWNINDTTFPWSCTASSGSSDSHLPHSAHHCHLAYQWWDPTCETAQITPFVRQMDSLRKTEVTTSEPACMVFYQIPQKSKQQEEDEAMI